MVFPGSGTDAGAYLFKWVRDGLFSNGVARAAFLVFASYDNRQPVCDALSPVWLSDALVGSALMLSLAWISPADWKRRLGLALGAGLIVAAFHAFTWPQESPASILAHAEDRVRWQALYSNDRVLIRMDPGWTQFEKAYFSVPGAGFFHSSQGAFPEL